MERFLPPTQYANIPAKPREESNLHQAGYGLHERGINKGWRRSNSMYVKASKYPIFSRVIIIGLGALILVNFRRNK